MVNRTDERSHSHQGSDPGLFAGVGNYVQRIDTGVVGRVNWAHGGCPSQACSEGHRGEVDWKMYGISNDH